jgi:hypothetical protein
MRDFQDGRFAKAWDSYKRALPTLRHDLYGSQHAAEFLLYCGDLKAATQAFVGFDGTPFWPSPPDPEVLARLRIANRKYAAAEALLQDRPSYLRYVALAEQGRRVEADDVLERVAEKDGLASVLLLRHRGRRDEAQRAADALCSGFLTHKP